MTRELRQFFFSYPGDQCNFFGCFVLLFFLHDFISSNDMTFNSCLYIMYMIYKAVVCFSYRLFFAHFCYVCIWFAHFKRSISFTLLSINILISILAVRTLCGKEEQSSSEQKKNLNKHSLRRKKRRPPPPLLPLSLPRSLVVVETISKW